MGAPMSPNSNPSIHMVLFRRVLRVSITITFVGPSVGRSVGWSAYRCNICMWLSNNLWDSSLQSAHAHASYWYCVLVVLYASIFSSGTVWYSNMTWKSQWTISVIGSVIGLLVGKINGLSFITNISWFSWKIFIDALLWLMPEPEKHFGQ